MKTNLLLLFLSFSFIASAQKANNSSLVLLKGEKINFSSKAEMETDMSMGMNMKNNVTQDATIVVTEISDKAYILSSTTNRIQLTGEMMGKDINFDSDKKEDMDSEIGTTMKTKIGKSAFFTLDKITGKVSVLNVDSSAKDAQMPINDILSGGQQKEEESISSAFFIIPSEKKIGDTWVDSTTDKQMKTIITYRFISTDKNIVTLSMVNKTDGTTTAEAQGNSMDITIHSTTTGDMLVDNRNFRVIKRTSVVDLSGNIDMMGQSMEISSKGKNVAEYK